MFSTDNDVTASGCNERMYEMIPEPNLWNTDRGLDEVHAPPTDLRHFHSNSNTSSSTMTTMGDPCRTLLRTSNPDAAAFKEELELHHQQQQVLKAFLKKFFHSCIIIFHSAWSMAQL